MNLFMGAHTLNYMKYIVLIFVIFVSCSSPSIEETYSDILKFTFENKNIKFEDVFSKATIIPLETTKQTIIANIDQIDVFDNHFIILDKKTKSVFVFTKTGRFVNRIGSTGKGPGQYIRPESFFVDQKEGTVEVYDRAQMKIVIYGINGSFKREIALKKYFHSVGKLNNQYWGFCSIIPNDGVSSQKKNTLKFIVFNESGQEVDRIFGKEIHDEEYHSTGYISAYNDNYISFVEPFSNAVYTIIDNKVKSSYKLDYSTFSPPLDELKRINNSKNLKRGAKISLMNEFINKYPFMFASFSENKKWLYFLNIFRTTTLIYNKETKSVKEFSGLTHSENSWETYFPALKITEDKLISVINPQFLYSIGNNKKANDARRNSFRDILSKIKESDNPLIIEYEIKQ